LGISLLVGLLPLPSRAGDFGRFQGEIITKWNSDNTNFTLLKDFIYQDGSGRKWTANAGLQTDCASIPSWFWPIVGNPCQGPYRKAAVVHDRYCIDKHLASSDDVHEMFYNAMRADGMSHKKALLFYGAVYLGGPHWRKVKGPQGEKIEVYRLIFYPKDHPAIMVPRIVNARDIDEVNRVIDKATRDRWEITSPDRELYWKRETENWLGRDGGEQFRKAFKQLD
jgi:hypothetical protein